jgi:hypothetical protein
LGLLSIVVAILLIIAAISIPNLPRSKMTANEASAAWFRNEKRLFCGRVSLHHAKDVAFGVLAVGWPADPWNGHLRQRDRTAVR